MINFKKDLLFFWIDELELILNTDLDFKDSVYFSDELIFNLDDDNTSLAYINILWINFKYSKIFPKGYEYGLKFETIIDDKIIDCFAILKGRKWRVITSKNKVVFYSSFFILEHLKKLPFSILEFTTAFNYVWINRLDLAFDIPYNIEILQEELFKNVNFFAQIWRDVKNELFSQTYYIWNPRSDRNRKYIFRIYDKILDTFRKQKGFLYPHLQNQTDVRRIELELRAEECKRLNFDLYDILKNEKNCLMKIFANYFNKYSIKKIDADKIYLKSYTSDFIDLKKLYLDNKQIPKDYMSRAYWYINNIKENTWYNWLFDVLIKKNWVNPYFINNSLDLLENYLSYLHKNNISKSLIQKIIKKSYFKN